MDGDLPDDAFRQPFPAFLRAAAQWLDSWTWPSNEDAAFHYVRALKAHPQLLGASADRAFSEIAQLIERRQPGIAPKAVDLRSEDGAVAYHNAWERVRFPLGTDPVSVACRLAGNGVIKTGKKRLGRYERFLTVAVLLQIQVHRKPILLPVR